MLKLKSAEELTRHVCPEDDFEFTGENQHIMLLKAMTPTMIKPTSIRAIRIKGSLVEQVEKEFYGRATIGLAQTIEQEIFASGDNNSLDKDEDDRIPLATQAYLDLKRKCRKERGSGENSNGRKKRQELRTKSSSQDLDVSNQKLVVPRSLSSRSTTKLKQLQPKTNHALIGFKSDYGLSVFFEIDHVGDLPKTTIIWIDEGINYTNKNSLVIVPGSTVPTLKVLAAVTVPLKN